MWYVPRFSSYKIVTLETQARFSEIWEMSWFSRGLKFGNIATYYKKQRTDIIDLSFSPFFSIWENLLNIRWKI